MKILILPGDGIAPEITALPARLLGAQALETVRHAQHRILERRRRDCLAVEKEFCLHRCAEYIGC